MHGSSASKLGGGGRAEERLSSIHLRKPLRLDTQILLPEIFPTNLGEPSDERKGYARWHHYKPQSQHIIPNLGSLAAGTLAEAACPAREPAPQCPATGVWNTRVLFTGVGGREEREAKEQPGNGWHCPPPGGLHHLPVWIFCISNHMCTD